MHKLPRTRAKPAITPERYAERLDRLKALLAEGKYNREIQEELGIARSTLCYLLKSNGLRSNLMPKSMHRIDAVVALRKLGKSYAECGRILGKTKGAISGILTRHGMTKRTPFKGVRRFSPERDAMVRAAVWTGEPIALICERCNALPGEPVSKRQVSNRANAMRLRRPEGYKPGPQAGAATAARPPRMPRNPRPLLLWPLPAPIPRRELPDDPAPDDWCPGGARVPVTREWADIRAIALNEGFVLMSFHDLPAYNKSRRKRNLAPYAIPRSFTNKLIKWR